jgi:hypothetical protein
MKPHTAFLAVALAFGLCQVAAADAPAAGVQDARSPDLVAPAVATPQDLRAPDQVAAVATTQDLRAADQVAPADATQDLRAPDQVAAAAATQDLRAPDQSTPAPSGLASPVEATDAVSTSGGGLSTMWIVLICLGGAAALAAAGYTAMRVADAYGRPSG